MPLMMGRGNMLRERTGHEAKVSYAELFFDLVYVFAVTQLSHFLLRELTPIGALQTLLLWFAVWLGWQYTCWVTNWFDPDKLPVRALLLALMLVALPMAAAIPQAFGDRGVLFACCYVLIQVGRSLCVLWFLGPDHALTPNFRRILGWVSISAVFWLAGAWAEGWARIGLWAIAVACEYISPMTGFALPGLGRSSTSDWTIEGGHLAERCQLFVIMALGESVLVTGATLSDAAAWDLPILAAFALAFISSLAMWWIYFDTSSRDASHAIAHAKDPGRLGAGFHYVHVVIVAGVIVAAVGSELAIAHPHEVAKYKYLSPMLLGPAIYLLGNALFRRVVFGTVPVSHVVAIMVLAVMALLAYRVDLLVISALTALLLIVVAVWDGCTQRKSAA